MKRIICFLFGIWIFGCNEGSQNMSFAPVPKEKLSGFAFSIPDLTIYNSAKKTHDSCMGFSFDANAIFIKTRDTFFIGDVVNKRSLKILNRMSSLDLSRDRMIAEFNTVPSFCTEKYNLKFSLKSALGENFKLELQNQPKAINEEINNAIASSDTFNVEAGVWVYLDITDALKHRLDTTTNLKAIRYKEAMLDSSNMVLTSVEAIISMTFSVHPAKALSKQLISLLKKRPFVVQQLDSSIQLSFKDNDSFDLVLTGFFPVSGEFVTAVSK